MSLGHVAFLGNSHLSAVARAVARTKSSAQVLQMTSDHVPPYTREGTNPAILELLGRLHALPTLVSLIGGNGHNILGLIEMTPAIEVFDNESPALLAGRHVVPREVFRAALLARIQMWLRLMSDVRTALPNTARMLHCCPPPPIESVAYIEGHAGPFREQIQLHGVAPASVRMKIWRLHTEILREHCDTIGAELMPPPGQCLTTDGFLAPAYYGGDPSHANADYGAAVLQQVQKGIVDASVL